MDASETDVCVNGARTINDDGPKEVKGKVDIVAKEKQTDANSEIYYAMHLSKNRTLTTPDKTNKTLILVNS